MPQSTSSSGSKSAATRRPAPNSGSKTSATRRPAPNSGSKTPATHPARICGSKYAKCIGNKTGKNRLPATETRVTCVACRKYDNDKAKKRRDERLAKDLALQKEGKDMRLCWKCPAGDGAVHREKDMGRAANGKIVNLCKKHYESRKAVQDNRERGDRRAEYREYDSRPERKVAKAQWRKDNTVKTYCYSVVNRMKKRAEDEEGFLKRNAETAARRRQAHPEETRAYQLARRTQAGLAYSQCISRCVVTGYILDLNIDEYEKLVTSPCYYCSEPYNKILHSVDRIDSRIGYTADNVVPACHHCNMMKNTLNESTFLLMITQVVLFSRFKKVGPYNDIFNDRIGTRYQSYRDRATKKNLDFDISEDTYELMTLVKPCYICNRRPTKTHTNGMDRYDNKLGYTTSNTYPCCADCNYLKKDSDFHVFLFKCCDIFNTHKHRLDALLDVWTPSRYNEKNLHKPSADDLENIRAAKRDERKAARDVSTTLDAIAERAISMGHSKGTSKADIVKELVKTYGDIFVSDEPISSNDSSSSELSDDSSDESSSDGFSLDPCAFN